MDRGPTSPDQARSVLARYARVVGDAGRAAAAADPGVLAILDQATASVGDALDPERRPPLVELACYADGLTDKATALGWNLPDVTALDWRRADQITWRLVAVCELAEALLDRDVTAG
ncbi:hypothetical protein Cme02nite_37810 [Catellatospora methionotrophica]|uniref:Uncharacterized protein n=1 Tax=Catellatospora methionotrophica TaxID=121620 RepID=A0A8J3LBR8_9ACTN|nr:DUF6401 family natural product biosynthesis protein [Catellatospora methionotrophica]GIG15449.1 hypothetical protein Cme02nite_37810 [Catellatospora methionotrophica]